LTSGFCREFRANSLTPKIRGGGGIPGTQSQLSKSRSGEKKIMGLEDVPRFQHVKINGTQCGSPALRARRYCFFHDKIRREQSKIAASASAARFNLPLLEDANSVQVALMNVIQMLGSGTIDHKTAGLMLYALQTASINLRNVDFEANDVTDVVIDRDTVAATCIDGPQWFEDDFEAAQEEDEEEADEEGDEENEAEIAADAEESADTAQANADSAPKPPAKNEPKHVTLEEARKQVQAVARNWLSETLAQKPQ